MRSPASASRRQSPKLIRRDWRYHMAGIKMTEITSFTGVKQPLVFRRCRALLVVSFFCALLFSLPGVADAAEIRRMALLIGNADYSFNPLKNPLNDANDLGRKLSAIGFETTVLANPDYKQFKSAIKSFYDEVSQDSSVVSVFYYAGHAVQMNSVNYLISVDAQIVDQQSMINGSISINDLLRRIVTTSNHQNLIILDACRDNPFKGISSTDKGRGIVK